MRWIQNGTGIKTQKRFQSDWSGTAFGFQVSECDESYEVNFLLPGFTKNEVSVTLKDSEITVEASIEDSEHAPAFGRKDYFRVLEIPESCDNGKVSANSKMAF